MTIEKIYLSSEKGGPQTESERVELIKASGISGDRHFGQGNEPAENVTLVEAEEIERFCRETGRETDLSITRRNLVTRGVRLNDLVGEEFRIGDAKLRGLELCEPCAILGGLLADEHLTKAQAVKRWVGRGGLRAEVLESGTIQSGEPLEQLA